MASQEIKNSYPGEINQVARTAWVEHFREEPIGGPTGVPPEEFSKITIHRPERTFLNPSAKDFLIMSARVYTPLIAESVAQKMGWNPGLSFFIAAGLTVGIPVVRRIMINHLGQLPRG